MEAVVPLHSREINSQWQSSRSWTVGQPQLRISGSFYEPKNNERVLLQFSVLYGNKFCFVSSVWMDGCTSACVNVSSEYKGLTWTVYILKLLWVRRIFCLDIRCCTHNFFSGITKAFHSGAACQYFSMRAQPKVPAHTDNSSVAGNAKETNALLASTSTDLHPCFFADMDQILSLRAESVLCFLVLK